MDLGQRSRPHQAEERTENASKQHEKTKINIDEQYRQTTGWPQSLGPNGTCPAMCVEIKDKL